jgi:hypothetical protein
VCPEGSRTAESLDLTWGEAFQTATEQSYNSLPWASSQLYPITAYILTWSEGSSGVFSNTKTVSVTNGGDLATTITGLNHATSYSFKIAAVNAVGVGQVAGGDNSPTARTFTTLGEPSAPGTPASTFVTHSSALVGWLAPDDHSAPITSFQLSVAPSGGALQTAVWDGGRSYAILPTYLEGSSATAVGAEGPPATVAYNKTISTYLVPAQVG